MSTVNLDSTDLGSLQKAIAALVDTGHETSAKVIRTLLKNGLSLQDDEQSIRKDEIETLAGCLYKDERDALTKAIICCPVSQEQVILFKKAIAYHEAYAHLYPWANQQYARMKEQREQGMQRVLKEEASVADVLLDMVCEENLCHLDGADMEFIDRKQLWMMLNEILFAEEYFTVFDNEHPLILDCGVNIGLAIYYAKRRYPDARIIGFEPWSKAWECAMRNVERNHWTDVTLHHMALGGKEDTLQLTITEENSLGSTVTNRMDELIGEKNMHAHKEQVPVGILSPYLSQRVDFLKMDIEGMEGQVLRECSSKLTNVKWLFIEHHFAKQLSDNNLSDILSLLQALGFQFEISKSQAYDTKNRPFLHLGKMVSAEIWAKNMS